MVLIEPQSIVQLLEAASIRSVHAAVVDTFGDLLLGVDVISHPGKLDIADIIDQEIKKLPAVMVGWQRVRPNQNTAGQFMVTVDFIAYVAVSEFVDLHAKKRIKREEVGHAIGQYMLRVLMHESQASWGQSNISLPEISPLPEFKPVFTAKSYSKGVAYYAVTWSQSIHDMGTSIATDPDFIVVQTDDGLASDDFHDEDVLLALVREAERKTEEGN